MRFGLSLILAARIHAPSRWVVIRRWYAASHSAGASATVSPKPGPFVPGRLSKVEFELPDVYHTFRRDHRIMVEVQSSWFPLVDRNPQKYVDIYNARESDFERSMHRVYRQRQAASHLRMLVLP